VDLPECIFSPRQQLTLAIFLVVAAALRRDNYTNENAHLRVCIFHLHIFGLHVFLACIALVSYA